MSLPVPSSNPPDDSVERRSRRRRAMRAPGLVVCAALVVAACSSSSKSSSTTGGPGATTVASPSKELNIVAGQNFWGSIVTQLAGKAGKVTSVVTDPNADPHNYESS